MGKRLTTNPAEPEMRMLFSSSLNTPEGIRYTPTITTERDERGRVIRLEVGLLVEGHFDEPEHWVKLVPSTSTDEGMGTGNVFLYEDDEPLTHVAWGMNNKEDRA